MFSFSPDPGRNYGLKKKSTRMGSILVPYVQAENGATTRVLIINIKKIVFAILPIRIKENFLTTMEDFNLKQINFRNCICYIFGKDIK